jgi:hypothetical protein
VTPLIRPDSRRLSNALRGVALGCVMLLGGCLYGQQRDLTELAQGEIWLALPMGSWLGTQNMGEPEAIAACLAPTCANRVAVGVFRLENNKATQTEAELRDPQLLVRMLNARQNADGNASRVRFDLDAAAFSTGGLEGFSLVVARQGDGAAVLHAAAVGRRDGKDLRVVFAVGDEAGVVRAAVAQLVEEGF